MTQACTKCNVEKYLEEFHKHPTTKNGRNTTTLKGVGNIIIKIDRLELIIQKII